MQKHTQLSQLLIALWSLDDVGHKTLAKILAYRRQQHLRVAELWRSLDGSLAGELALSEKTLVSLRAFKQRYSLANYVEWLAEQGIQVLTTASGFYPSLLQPLVDRPPVLFVRSQQPVNSEQFQAVFVKTLAVVGTRRMTGYGRLAIRTLLTELVQTHSIVSGFMYGVDVTAQQVALQQAGGRTIGVLGFGFEHCFPRSQRQLLEEFVARGAIFLTEFAPRISAHAGNFVQRNRIIAGLAPATLVIEAAERSGSHITAAYANEYGRLVMAVPGPITNPYSQGTKALIEQGATLVTSSRDIYQALGEDYQSALTLGLQSDTDLSATIVEALTSQSALNFDELLAISQQDKSLLQQALLRLELAGKIHKSCGTYCLS